MAAEGCGECVRNAAPKHAKFNMRKPRGRRGRIGRRTESELYGARTPEGSGTSCGPYRRREEQPFRFLTASTTTPRRDGRPMGVIWLLFPIVTATPVCGFRKFSAASSGVFIATR